jgi:guanylate kinase
MRAGEVDGKDYHFLTKDNFEKQIKEDGLIEWAQVHSNYYGTSKMFVDRGLKEGKKMLFDLDVQGADAMKKIYAGEAQVIFIEPPTIFELERRLKSRGTDEDKVITERMNNAREELRRKNDFDFLIMNDDVEEADKKFKAAVQRILL